MPGSAPPSPAAASLAAAESAFAAQSVREGMRAAFLAWLAPDATIFRDGPVNGPAAVAARPDPPIVLDWRPVFVEVAASGEVGLSTGPWTITRRQDPAAAPRHGQFVSVWTRSGGGPWRVRVDLGIPHPGAALADASLDAHEVPPASTTCGPAPDAESRFASLAAASGDAGAYAALASDSIRIYREGHSPYLGRAAAPASREAAGSRTAWQVLAQESSASADFAWAYGSYGPAAGAAAGHFLRVWRCEAAGWRIALDVTNALAPR